MWFPLWLVLLLFVASSAMLFESGYWNFYWLLLVSSVLFCYCLLLLLQVRLLPFLQLLLGLPLPGVGVAIVAAICGLMCCAI